MLLLKRKAFLSNFKNIRHAFYFSHVSHPNFSFFFVVVVLYERKKLMHWLGKNNFGDKNLLILVRCIP
jgi:hypothetical protein